MNSFELLNTLSKNDLEHALKRLGDKISGKKSEQIERLLENYEISDILFTQNKTIVDYLASVLGLTYTKKEETITNILNRLKNLDSKAAVTSEKQIRHESAIDELNSLVGLSGVKDKVNKIRTFLTVQKRRKELGLQEVKVSQHMIFTGNPGTGKTTVARCIADILTELNYLSTGQLVEVTRSDLIGKYYGDSDEKAKQILEKANGGVLFIDEAYSLTQDKNDSFGKAVVTALLTGLENQRHNLVVILAGYKKEMEQFLKSDPGLRSRFSNEIEFEDYNEHELLEIMESQARAFDYKLNDELKVELTTHFSIERQKEHFANARSARNLLEKIIQNHSQRLVEKNLFDEESMILLTLDDMAY